MPGVRNFPFKYKRKMLTRRDHEPVLESEIKTDVNQNLCHRIPFELLCCKNSLSGNVLEGFYHPGN